MMTTETKLELPQGAVAQIVEAVFATMMNLEVKEAAQSWAASADRLTASVHLTGEWNGVVMMECDARQACHFAGRFLSLEPPQSVDETVRDVLGELANIIGGNVKCVLTPGIRLSMPAVIDGEFRLRVCGAKVQERLPFTTLAGNFCITVLTTENVNRPKRRLAG
jgi:chemotaxis protein CheX